MATKTGSAGNDTLNGTTAADSLTGGRGNDTLNGGLGADVYSFSKGDGYDTISDYDTNLKALDRIVFKDLASTDMKSVTRIGNDLIFYYGSDDRLTVSDYFYNANYAIETFQFTDLSLTRANIAKLVVYTEGNDSYDGFSDLSNTIRGLGGNDSIRGGELADLLYGDAGDDTLTGNGGADQLTGGRGDDTLSGGDGADIYHLAKGDGSDVIRDYHDISTPIDTIQFKDVKATDIKQVYRTGNDLVLEYGAEDMVTVSDYFYSAKYQVERVKFADGLIWDRTAIATRLVYSEGDDNYSGFIDLANKISGLGGNDSITGGALNDTLNGDDGDDVLKGGGGNDTLVGGLGADRLEGEAGNDTYLVRKGDGVDSINDYSANIVDIDVVTFSDVTVADVRSVSRQGNNLLLQYGATDTVIVNDYFYSKDFQVEKFSFSGGVAWDKAAIASRLVYTAGNDNYAGFDDVANTIHGLGGDDRVNGGALADVLYGDAGADRLFGAAGNDTLTGGIGNDFLEGGAGSDTYSYAKGAGADTINDYSGSATEVDTVRFEGIASTSVTSVSRFGNNLVIKQGPTDRVTVNDYFYHRNFEVDRFTFSDATWTRTAIAQRLAYTEGDDSYNGFEDAANTIHGLGGHDRITGGALVDTLYGDAGDDTLRGGAGNDILSGGTGNDSLEGGAGNDTYLFRRGDGTDRISDYDAAGPAIDTVQFLDYNQRDITKIARSGNDLIVSFADRDKMVVQDYFYSTTYRVEQYKFADGTIVKGFTVGAEGQDTVMGTDGNDFLDGGAGADTMTGGKGNDIYVLDNSGDVAVEAANGGNDTVMVGFNYSLSNKPYIENVILTGTADYFATGNDADNILVGNSGNNRLSGGIGNDYLDGRAGADNLSGLQGNDTYIIDNIGDLIQELEDAGGGYGGKDIVQSSITYTLGAYLETLALSGTAAINGTGNASNNLIEGNTAANKLDGMGGKDVLGFTLDSTVAGSGVVLNLGITDAEGYSTASGGAGADKVRNFEDIAGSKFADTFTGNSGNNSIFGYGGDDAINGGSGNDTLSGGAGKDVLSGGLGKDSFVFDAALGSTNIDTVKDFKVEDDVIGLSKAIFKALPGAAATVLNEEWLHRGAGVTKAVESDDYILYNSTTGALYYDADGSGTASAAVRFATLTGAPMLTYLDFGIVS